MKPPGATARHPTRRRYASSLLAALVAVMIAACGWLKEDASCGSRRMPHLVWPEPPAAARIELVALFGSASELGIERSIWRRLADLVTGGGEARMVRPTGVAVHGLRIAVADPGSGLVRVFDLSEHQAMALEGCGDRVFGEPVAVTMTGEHLYVSDATAASIHVLDGGGRCEGSWSLPPDSRPAGLAIDPQRSLLYVADAGAHQVLVFDLHGKIVLRFGKRGAEPGEFNYPTWLALDASGNLYVTDALNFRVQQFDPDGELLGVFGRHGDGSGDLARPKGIGVDRFGHVYLVDALFDAVQIFDGQGRYLMVFGARGEGPGHFWLPSGLAVEGDRIYVADSYNQRVQVFRFLGGES